MNPLYFPPRAAKSLLQKPRSLNQSQLLAIHRFHFQGEMVRNESESVTEAVKGGIIALSQLSSRPSDGEEK